MSSLSNLHQEKDGNQLEKEAQREARLQKTRGKAWYVNQMDMFLVAIFILDSLYLARLIISRITEDCKQLVLPVKFNHQFPFLGHKLHKEV